MYPIIDSEEGNFVQIDLMLRSSPEDTAWLMSGTGDDQVKGVYRNLLLAFIAKIRSKTDNDPNSKMTIQRSLLRVKLDKVLCYTNFSFKT